jgi:hypothetical protein
MSQRSGARERRIRERLRAVAESGVRPTGRVDDGGRLTRLLGMKFAKPFENVRHLAERVVEVREVRKPVFINRVSFIGVVDTNSDRLGELEVVGSFDVDDRLERNGDLSQGSLALPALVV